MKLNCLILIGLLLVGCNQTTDNEAAMTTKDSTASGDTLILPAELSEFSWLVGANSTVDAKQAIAKGDMRLLAASLRGVVLPGIDAGDQPRLKQACQYRFMAGVGDVLKTPEQRIWWKKAMAYAKEYNQIVAAHCKK
jgi:hypothetical protein